MNKEINLNYKGTTYTLAYNRMSVKIIESEGFELEKFSAQPMNMIDLVFKGAFYKNHRKVSQSIIDDIYKSCPDKTKLIENLTNMITDCYSSLTDEPSEGDAGNVTWEVVDLTPKTSQK